MQINTVLADIDMNDIIPILLVEDDEVDAEAVRRALKKARILNPVCNARDGIEALEYLKGHNGKEEMQQPCLMLVDLNMPRMNGFELLAEIGRDEKMKQNIVFVLTTSARVEDKQHATDLQAHGYVVKDNLDTLPHVLSEYLEQNALQSLVEWED